MKEIKSILFIGNSYTYYNDMPSAIFSELLKADGREVEVTAITKGGWTLEKFADPTDTYGAAVDAALSESGKYGIVILQEQSLRPAINKEKFFAAAENLAARIRATGAEPVLYATWGRHSDSPDLETHHMTNRTMTERLDAAYSELGEKIGAPVVHVGKAFYEIYTERGEIDLYNPDLSHPSYAGSYLAASALYAALFGDVPQGFDGELSPETAALLRKIGAKYAKD